MSRTSLILAGRCRLDARIAIGGVGEVWRAVDLVLARPVAVKLLRPVSAGGIVSVTVSRLSPGHGHGGGNGQGGNHGGD